MFISFILLLSVQVFNNGRQRSKRTTFKDTEGQKVKVSLASLVVTFFTSL